MRFTDFLYLVFASSTKREGNMSSLRGDKEETYQNRRKFLEGLTISPHNVLMISLFHGNTVMVAQTIQRGNVLLENPSLPECDAIITNQKDLYLFMVTADCLPIGLFDPRTKSIGLVHGSWKSLDNEILENTIEKMQTVFGTRPEDLIIESGPSIGPCCYKKITTIEQKRDWGHFVKKDNATYTIDIRGYAEDILIRKGVQKENLHISSDCTYHSLSYFSHRRFVEQQEAIDSRFATIIGIKD